MGFRHRDPEERIVYVERESGGGFGWFVFGAALGASLGLLFAPQSGRRTRRELGHRLTTLKGQAEEGLEALADGIEEGAERIRARVERWSEHKDDADEDVDEEDEEDEETAADEAGDEPRLSAREELERRLRDARARRRADAADEEPVA